MAEPDTTVLFTHWYTWYCQHPNSLSFSALAICCFNDRPHITNYTAQRYPSSHSSTLTFINILLVSLGARDFIPPQHTQTHWHKSLLLLLFKSPIFIVTKRALFEAQTLQGKLILVDHCHRSCHGFSHTCWWLDSFCVIAGCIPDSQRHRDINDSDVPPYRLQAVTSKLSPQEIKLRFFLIRIRFLHKVTFEKYPL